MGNLSKAIDTLDAEFEATMATMGLSEAQKVELRKAKKSEGRSRRTDEATYLSKRPHAIPGTLAYDPKANKQFVMIKCQVLKGDEICGTERKVYTSDLHQVNFCTGCEDAQRDQKKVERAELLKRFKAAEAAKKVAPVAPVEEPSTEEVQA